MEKGEDAVPSLNRNTGNQILFVARKVLVFESLLGNIGIMNDCTSEIAELPMVVIELQSCTIYLFEFNIAGGHPLTMASIRQLKKTSLK
jgi:hypothetical protein